MNSQETSEHYIDSYMKWPLQNSSGRHTSSERYDARIKSLLHPQLWELADIRFPIVPRYSLLEKTASPWKPCDSPKILLLPPPPPHTKHTSLVINSVPSIAPKKCFLVSKEKNVTYETTSALQKNTFPVSGTTRKLLFNTGGDSVNVTKK